MGGHVWNPLSARKKKKKMIVSQETRWEEVKMWVDMFAILQDWGRPAGGWPTLCSTRLHQWRAASSS